MNLTELTQQALHINDLFKKLEKKNQVKEWDQQRTAFQSAFRQTK